MPPNDPSLHAAPFDPAHSPIRAHIEKYLGRIDSVIADAAGNDIRIDVHHVPPTPTRPLHTLITAGMSDRAMRVPPGVDAPRHLELMVTLPADWQVADRSERWHWPIRQLQHIARLPHAQGSWLGWGHTVPNGDPPTPRGPHTKLCGAIIAPSLLVPTGFYELAAGERRIAFFSVIPINREEMDLKRKGGMEALLSRLVDHSITDVIDPRRR